MLSRFKSVRFAVTLLAVTGMMLNVAQLDAGFRQSAVGGVIVNDKGVVENAKADAWQHLKELRQAHLNKLPADVNKAGMRKISLKRLQGEILARKQSGEAQLITEEMYYLAGMTRLQYVFVYPEEKDIVLVGPGEKLKLTADGEMVGADSGRPALRLDQLLVALRTAEDASKQVISCSIDPTKEGIAAVQKLLNNTRTYNSQVADQVEQAMGLQNVTITGVPGGSDFARTMVAADYRMKRLAMGMDQSPVSGLPSYLSMLSAGSTGVQSMTPRWWLAPNYEGLHKDHDGLAWELRGKGVKVMTEDSLIAANGDVTSNTGKTSAKAQKWADLMTERYDALSSKIAVFGELRNIMDLAVFSAVIVKEDLAGKSGCDLSVLMDKQLVANEDFFVPQKVDTRASVVKSGNKHIISASGGVEINSWQIADGAKESDSMASIRDQHSHAGMHWWWN